ncbi:hypothetical protein AMS68_000563 [Peltaster fructicola]|uniref:RING-CH-type domain-containing protein n=1 Tax=Peltaster fructicola TaxID=286661 RepID=A0A6H0XK05_9PEZI|nr:hypothetical protein AMS68_000563 [Peltaster fructicola]
MASMQRRPSQRRSSPVPTPSQEATPPIATTESRSTQAVDDSQEGPVQAELQDEQPAAQPRLLSADDDPSVKKCWICFSDSTEDTPETSPWRDPCPCALVAHEECLLDWIADAEAPKNTSRGGLITPQILCPQCKAEIKLARPRNYIVDIVRLLDRSTARLVMPGGVVLLSLDLLYKLSFAHGEHSIYRIFGTADADRILLPVLQNRVRPPTDFEMPLPQIRDRALMSVAHYIQHWRLYLGLPLVTPILLLSRTTWHFSEALLTVVPTLFFALQPSYTGEPFSFVQWPPSASMAFALLPYVRQGYNMYYERVWGARVRGWRKEILPLTSQTQTTDTPAHDPVQAIEDAADDTNVFEIRVDGGIWEEWEEHAPVEDAQPEIGQAAEEAGPEVEGAAPAPDVPVEPAQPAQRQAVQAERRLSFSPASLAESVLGALVFPTIAELSGELLRLALPKAWTSPAAAIAAVSSRSGFRAGSKGILHEKWGRSLIGGCLFVVFKDALMIYVRWKMAQMHRNRRVLDYDRAKPRV